MSNISIFQNRIIYAELTGLQNNSAILSKKNGGFFLPSLVLDTCLLKQKLVSTFLGISEGMKLVSTVCVSKTKSNYFVNQEKIMRALLFQVP